MTNIHCYPSRVSLMILPHNSSSISMVAIAKHSTTHTKTMPKYVAPNLRGPKII